MKLQGKGDSHSLNVPFLWCTVSSFPLKLACSLMRTCLPPLSIPSGLDSENALAITKLLKRLCSSRKVAAMMVIHQPDGMLFREFDQLILLSGGKTIFCDHTSKLPDLYKNVFKEDVHGFGFFGRICKFWRSHSLPIFSTEARYQLMCLATDTVHKLHLSRAGNCQD